jgi:hypothetical protein
MVYISIGEYCCVKHQIYTHKHKIETLFFDWLVTSMESVIEVLSGDINQILTKDTVVLDTKNPIFNNKSRILIQSLHSCVSVHDVKVDFNDTDILEFIDTYKRRWNRILTYIRSQEKIYFIRFGPVTPSNQLQFITTILKLNPKCNFELVVIDNTAFKIGYLRTKHCLYLNLNVAKVDDWTCSYLNWELLFSFIENMCP